MPAAMRLQKMVTFAGLTVELFEDVQEVTNIPCALDILVIIQRNLSASGRKI